MGVADNGHIFARESCFFYIFGQTVKTSFTACGFFFQVKRNWDNYFYKGDKKNQVKEDNKSFIEYNLKR